MEPDYADLSPQERAFWRNNRPQPQTIVIEKPRRRNIFWSITKILIGMWVGIISVIMFWIVGNVMWAFIAPK
ncbi:MAG TPA: hypothetical protein PK677_14325 [Acidiphilium sp.]|nr:hypothetical protein [Acidiphilium sp.]